jgi:hypothetical protein
MIEVGMGENNGIQLFGGNVDGKTDFVIYHDPIVHEDLTACALDGDGRPTYFLTSS